MINEHHDLIHEFPEHRERIREMKMQDAHFSRLFDEYHEVTKTVEKMEAEIEPVCTQTEEEIKFKRLKLKDELYSMLKV
ncbi:MAG: YdcH family protein [Neptuniibacter sp.]